MLVECDKRLLSALDTDGSTALNCAIWRGHRQIVTFLPGTGSDVHADNSNPHWGTTPLQAAAHADPAAIAQLLSDAGPGVNVKDLNGKTPLHHTTFDKANAAAKVLAKNGGV